MLPRAKNPLFRYTSQQLDEEIRRHILAIPNKARITPRKLRRQITRKFKKAVIRDQRAFFEYIKTADPATLTEVFAQYPELAQKSTEQAQSINSISQPKQSDHE